MNMSRAWPTAPIADVVGAQPSTREIRPSRPTAGLPSPQPVRCASSNGVPCLSWDGDFDIGIPAIDRDHRQLLDLFARVQTPGWSTESRELVRATVDDLAHHVTHHFRREEMLMHLLGYPGTERHHRSHVALAARLREFQSLLCRDPRAVPDGRFRDFLAGPLLSHLMSEDMEIKPWVDGLTEATAT